ncbi:23S rRNA (adenine(2503)-C(2))-methyltransferase RlmN [Ileibacterium valens]|uniref:23S rRNA (adenine(2503)-C(2))-methyltransferase RlmN n=1 Tax=Ileibacterium valens TaxID=1862668 RepID=UPI0035152E6D
MEKNPVSLLEHPEQSLRKKSIYDMTYEQMEDWAVSKGWKKFRIQQIYNWLYKSRVDSFEEMTNLSKETRKALSEEFEFTPLELVRQQIAKDGTRKFLFRTEDGALLESVMMVFDYGNSVCVSSQVGCNMGCAFCASGLTKKSRNLKASEMVAQFMAIQKELDRSNERVSHIVVMGTGEPFDNYENVMNFLKTVNHDRGLAIGSRHITISTCGVVPKIYEFADGHYQYNLAVSLHAPNNRLRDSLMPINKAYPLEELMKAIDYYTKENNRRLTFEYILLNGVNNSVEDAKELARLLRPYNCYVNLIPYNSVDEHGFRPVNREEAMKFYDVLKKEKIAVTIRKEHGSDIDAACGQLRIKEIRKGRK